MSGRRKAKSLKNFEDALARLAEALAETDPSPLMIDGTIQRFEFCVELCWKSLKRFLADEGVQAGSPRDTLRQAFAIGWIANEAGWIAMLDDRNSTSHIYNQETARAIFARMPDHSALMTGLRDFLNER